MSKGREPDITLCKKKSQGMGRLSWERLQERLRQSGELGERQQLKSVYLDKNGFYYTTSKA